MRGRVVSRPCMIVVSALAMLVLAGCPYTKTDLHNAEDATQSAKRDWATEKADENFTRTRVDYFRSHQDSQAYERADYQYRKQARKVILLEDQVRRLKLREDSIRAHCCFP